MSKTKSKKSLQPIYYVYRYIRLDTNTPFYVGKGEGKRAYKFNRIVTKTGHTYRLGINKKPQ